MAKLDYIFNMSTFEWDTTIYDEFVDRNLNSDIVTFLLSRHMPYNVNHTNVIKNYK